MTDTEQIIYDSYKNYPNLSSYQIASIIGCSQTTVNVYAKRLCTKGYLEKTDNIQTKYKIK